MGLFDTFKKPEYVIVSYDGNTYSPKAKVCKSFVEGLYRYTEPSTEPILGVAVECFKLTCDLCFGKDGISVILFEGDFIFLKSDWDKVTKK